MRSRLRRSRPPSRSARGDDGARRVRTRQQLLTQRSTDAGHTPICRAVRASSVANRFGWRGLLSNGGEQKQAPPPPGGGGPDRERDQGGETARGGGGAGAP